MKASELYSRDRKNKPARVPIVDEWGKPIEGQWFEVVGNGSDLMMEWMYGSRDRAKAVEACKTEKEKAKLIRQHRLQEAATAVVGWSLEDTLSLDAVMALLDKSTDNFLAVFKAIYEDELFFGRKPSDSSSGPNESSTSPEESPAKAAPSATS